MAARPCVPRCMPPRSSITPTFRPAAVVDKHFRTESTLSEAWKDIGGVIPFPVKHKPDTRGRRWAEDETVPAVWVFDGHELRKKHKLPRINLNLEAEKFVNWALSASGKVAVKVNWKRTFLNWCINARGVPEQEPATPVYTAADNDRR